MTLLIAIPLAYAARTSRFASLGPMRPADRGTRPVLDLGHNKQVFLDQFNGGRMNGFVNAIRTQTGRVEDTARARASGDEARTVIAGYHWFTDWGRDTMISLEGLTNTRS